MLEIKINSEDEIWNHFLSEQKENQLITIAHNPSLGNILKNAFGYKCFNYVIYNKDSIVGIFPVCKVKNKIVSMPHFSYGDILLNSDNKEKKDIKKKILGKNYEIRSFESFSKNVDESKVMCYLDLCKTEKEQWEYWNSKLRNNIRKGIKNNISVKVGGAEYLKEFYKIYTVNMRDLGSPVLSYKFFKNIFEFYKYGEAKIFIAHKDGINMAASIVLTYQNFAEVCWASALRKHNALKPNLVIYWKMIKYAINKRYKYFSFGRSSKDSNTLIFKKHWKPIEKQLYFNLSKPKTIDIKKMKFLNKIWCKMPLILTNNVGPYFSKNIY